MWCLSTVAFLFLAGESAGYKPTARDLNCWNSLNMIAGDVITCHLSGLLGLAGMQHYMLACQNWGKYYSDMTRDKAMARAKSYKDAYVYHGKFTCNSQHWVNKWIRGAAGFSTASMM
ncbi:hypothetical protein J6590_056857 [Homalodisca vitripennis]|nr:hypothetical protein J6590_056857 [Homalodisca vitripennis]